MIDKSDYYYSQFPKHVYKDKHLIDIYSTEHDLLRRYSCSGVGEVACSVHIPETSISDCCSKCLEHWTSVYNILAERVMYQLDTQRLADSYEAAWADFGWKVVLDRSPGRLSVKHAYRTR